MLHCCEDVGKQINRNTWSANEPLEVKVNQPLNLSTSRSDGGNYRLICLRSARAQFDAKPCVAKPCDPEHCDAKHWDAEHCDAERCEDKPSDDEPCGCEPWTPTVIGGT